MSFTDLATLQQALDLYGAAAYWHRREPTPATETLTATLRERATGAGVSDEQLADADSYARTCIVNRRKPLLAGPSSAEFERLYA
jgi:hypothetical protein